MIGRIGREPDAVIVAHVRSDRVDRGPPAKIADSHLDLESALVVRGVRPREGNPIRRSPRRRQIRRRSRRGLESGGDDLVAVRRIPRDVVGPDSIIVRRVLRQTRVPICGHVRSASGDLRPPPGESELALDLEPLLIVRIIFPGQIDLVRKDDPRQSRRRLGALPRDRHRTLRSPRRAHEGSVDGLNAPVIGDVGLKGARRPGERLTDVTGRGRQSVARGGVGHSAGNFLAARGRTDSQIVCEPRRRCFSVGRCIPAEGDERVGDRHLEVPRNGWRRVRDDPFTEIDA